MRVQEHLGGYVPYVWIPGENLWYELILKLHGRCNLNCDYCYMYTLADQSWRDKPKIMSRETIDIVAERIAAYMREHRLPRMHIIFHGGEPLLAGVELIAYAVQKIKIAIPKGSVVLFTMQTNGTLLTEEVLEVLLAHEVKVGVSLDGDIYANRHRLFHNGGSSYPVVAEALQLLNQARYTPINVGLLSVIDLQNDPVETYEHLCTFNPPSIDFLLPLGHWSSPPPGKDPLVGGTPYADWLIKIFDVWFKNFQRGIPEIRYFAQIMEFIVHTSLRLKDYKPRPVPWNRRVEVIGPWTVGAGVIEVDGTYELLDAYKSIRHGEPALNLNVRDHHLTLALVQALQTIEQRKIHEMSPACRKCEVAKICGGGFYVHRYNQDEQQPYLNPSVYCADLKKLIMHIFYCIEAYLVQEFGK